MIQYVPILGRAPPQQTYQGAGSARKLHEKALINLVDSWMLIHCPYVVYTI